MQEIIERILEGNFDYENGSLDFSCSKLELTLRKGEAAEGSFLIYADAGRYTEGEVSSSDLRMECLTTQFSGENAEIFYCFHGEHMEEGDVVKGSFCVVSNQGEYYLPFVASVEHTFLDSSIGNIKNLFHFANLAKSNWQEALRLFYAPVFARVFEGSDRQFYECYRGLSVYPGSEQNMEEFLICINKKQKVDYVAQQETLVIDRTTADPVYTVTEEELDIVRNGWGYTVLQVECEGDFLFTEKELLTDDDFLGNRCRLPVFVDLNICRNGNNFGRIYLYNSYVSLTIPVVVRLGDRTAGNRARLSRKRDIAELMKLYQSFRLKKLGMSAWLKETEKVLERMAALDERDLMVRLFQAQLLISQERYNEADWTLNYVEELIEQSKEQDNTLKAYFLYLTTLIQREEDYIVEVTAQVERLYRHDRSNWRVAWLLLYLSEEYNKSAAGKWNFLEKQFEYGCSSPVLYIEALNVLNANPTVLRKLDAYSLQVLRFGARFGALNADVLEQLLYLSGKVREYSPILFYILKSFYAEAGEERVLQEICTLLIKGNRVGPQYFSWYQAGVEANLRITNLYEYYMMSLDLQTADELPKVVLMYFSYQSSMDYNRMAFLYSYVLRNREELGELYGNYRAKMEYFVLDQIQREHINRHLAALYQEFLSPALINEQTAGHLAKLLFAHQICVSDLRLKKVIVYQPGNLQPAEYPLQDGRAWAALYGNDCTILFEDAYGNRFTKNVDYMLEKLMIPGKYLRLLGEAVKDSIELDLYFCEYEKEADRLPGGTLERTVRVAEAEQVDMSIRRQFYLKLLKYYYEADDIRALDALLESLPVDEFSMEERDGILRYMVLRNRIDTAWEWVRTFGPYFVERKTLVRLVSEVISRDGAVEYYYLAGAARQAFCSGKYDSRILQYLVDYLRGPVRELRDVWKAARSFDLECYRLSERILVQMLYSGAFVGEKMDIFRFYVSQGANAAVEEAFLAQCAYDYFVREKLTENFVFAEIQKMYLRGEEVQKIEKLAFLKYYGENTREIASDNLAVIGSFLQDMMEERIHLNFFRNFAGMDFPQEHLLRELMDKTIVEYRARPGARAKIHYVVMYEDNEDAEYLAEPMREVYGGLCFKEFVLFFGENLQYYIMEEADGEAQLTESGNLQKSDARGGGEGWRYEILNDMAISRTLQDFNTFDSLVEEYYRREYLNRELFRLQ